MKALPKKFSLFLVLIICIGCSDSDLDPITRNPSTRGDTDQSYRFDQLFNLVEIELAQNPLKVPDKSELRQLQKQMWDRRIPVNPAYFHPVPADNSESNKLNQAEWHRFLSNFQTEQKHLYDSLMKNRDFITYQHLERALASFAQVFEPIVKEDYSIGLHMNKSSQWLASLILPLLNRKPMDAFTTRVDTMGNLPTNNHLLSPPKLLTPHLVIFDDMTYSGSQLVTILSDIGNTIKKKRITIFVAFASKSAKAKIKKWVETEKNNQVVLVTTKKSVKMLKDVLTETDIFTLFSKDKVSLNGKTMQVVTNWSLSYPAWKTPDGISFPDFLVASKLKKSPAGRIIFYGFADLTGFKGFGSVVQKNEKYYLLLPQPAPPYKGISLTEELENI